MSGNYYTLWGALATAWRYIDECETGEKHTTTYDEISEIVANAWPPEARNTLLLTHTKKEMENVRKSGWNQCTASIAEIDETILVIKKDGRGSIAISDVADICTLHVYSDEDYAKIEKFGWDRDFSDIVSITEEKLAFRKRGRYL